MKLTLLAIPAAFLAAAIFILWTGKRTLWAEASDSRRWRKYSKLLFFFLGLLALTLAFSGLKFTEGRKRALYLFVFDITPSQAVEDYTDESGRPLSRIEAARRMVIHQLGVLPPNARVAVAAFNGNPPEVMLFLPLTEVSRRGEIERALALVDWWNGWRDGSGIMYVAGEILKQTERWPKPFNIVVFSDGDTGFGEDESGASDNWQRGLSRYGVSAEKGTRFLLVGAGQISPSDVPKFDQDGKRNGCLGIGGKCYTSALKEKNLLLLAKALKGEYLNLSQKEEIGRWLKNPLVSEKPEPTEVSYDWVFGLAAMFFLVFWIII